MLFPALAARVLARNVLASSAFVVRRAPLAQITRSFSVSSVTWAQAAATAKAKPAAKKSTTAKKTTARKSTAAKKRPAAKKSTKKRKAAPKPKPKKAKKKVVKKTPTIKILPEHKPPKGHGNPYTFFFRKFFAGAQRNEGEPGKEFVARIGREAGPIWTAFSEQEKQPFVDEFNAAKVEYAKKRDEYYKNTSPTIIKELNKRRRRMGKRAIHVKRPDHPITSFFAFGIEERNKGLAPTGLKASEVMKEFGKRWRALSDAEKLHYKERGLTMTAERKAARESATA
ncbi:uncharacterized protein FOMMEDRAFT_144356 [Fomitiporia mediterranea MF3/22]|uniref:uncharacterized protein n=1 Tax=Fomitiporia mediterranea (strain MF3/22) TaxID=694068 RepID=UPI0004409885|nr:uncharacterized protein FOMMEDRAFT_144356 [Fomitiporia mediterranea MF3/22]EJD08504.1 hypothetical protein FOMMEDRAFT_144356 [Fomitiporia mediterranea MF3/22]